MATEKSVATVKPKPAAPTEGPGPLDRAKKYLGEVQTELKKTTWPSKPELISQTQVVFALLLVVGVFIAGWDFLLGQIFRLVLQAMGVRN